MSVTLRLSWPSKWLWQNRRPHWRQARDSARNARLEAWALMRDTSAKAGADPIILTFAFHPPNRVKRDLQNMPATQKAALDGIADALHVDDSTFTVRWPEAWGEVVKGGCVLVEVSGVITSAEEAVNLILGKTQGVVR